ncbi:hypothetical protein [Marinobacterium stanieri]|uniref:hypothetical protein n=1 Tax=Marinobacterium stanieri TaxID=49186 RepID=UPI000255A8C7|nr:hypothetical protein [Marinobacterium stanieri]
MKKVIVPALFLVLGVVGGFVLGAKAAGDQYEDRKNLVSTIRQLEQAVAYVDAFSQKGDAAVKSLILEDIKLHLLGTSLLVSKVPKSTRVEACRRVQRVAASRHGIIQFSESGDTLDPYIISILDQSSECVSW